MSSLGPLRSHLQAGKLRGLAVTSPRRYAIIPDIPTMAESGLPGFEVAVWQGVLAPAGTPGPVVDKIYAAIVVALARPDMKERMAANGTDIIGNTPATRGDMKAQATEILARVERTLKATGFAKSDIVDATVGVSQMDVVIPNGDSHVVQIDDFVIPAGASDPFVNTVNVHATIAEGEVAYTHPANGA